MVSIIVAVYNADQYLPRCLDSLLGQTYSDLEVIAVDDCSTDGSLQVLRTYAEKDNRLRVLQMEHNSGAPAARNKALSVSKGELMSTVDADDEISLDAIEKAVRIFEENPTVDIVTYKMISVNIETGKETPFYVAPDIPRRMSGKEACYWTLQWDIPGLDVVRSSLEKRFPADTTYGQYGDETTTHIVFYHAREVVLGEGIYYYYQTPESYTRNVSVKRFEILECRQSLRRQLLEVGADNKMMKRLDAKRWHELMGMCTLLWEHRHQFTTEERKQIWKRLKATYGTLHFSDLPLTLALAPFWAVMPTFSMFYIEQVAKFYVRKIIRRR